MFNIIAIIRKLDDSSNDNINTTVVFIEEYARENNIIVHEYKNGTLSPRATDVLFISLGGDGTMLYAAKESLKYTNSSVIGLNFGSLGFLVEDRFNVSVAAFLTEIREGDAIKDERMALDVLVGDEHFTAMNEVVLSTGQLGPPFVSSVFINGKFVAKQFGSGVLVSTSTGSTAMALSAGGAIVSPSTNIMQIVPIIPHSLSSRPIITSGRDKITVEAKLTNRTSEFTTTIDGQVVNSHNTSQIININHCIYDIQISKYEKSVTIWRPTNWNFFDVLSQKMGWGA